MTNLKEYIGELLKPEKKGTILTKELLEKLILHRKGTGDTEMPPQLYKGKSLVVECLVYLLSGHNLLLVGGKGTGKNTLAETLAWALGQKIFEMSLNNNVDTSMLFGEKTLAVEEGATVVKFEEHNVLKAMREGGVLILDEINTARADVLIALNAVCDARKRIDIGGVGLVQADKNFRIIATMNYGYQGTQELNEALTDRFVVVNVDTLPDTEFASLLIDIEGVDSKHAMNLVKLFKDLNKQSTLGYISCRSVTVRGLIQAMQSVKMGLDPTTALNACVTSKEFDPDSRLKIKDIISTYFDDGLQPRDWFPKLYNPAPTVPTPTYDTPQSSTVNVEGVGSLDLSKIKRRTK